MQGDLHTKTAILVMIDCPPKIQLAMDNIQLKIGSKFKGIKHIPQGAHYINYSLASENHMFKIGFFLYTRPGEVFVRKWSEEIQDFIDIAKSEEGERFISSGKNMELEMYLAEYPLERIKLWRELSDFISLSNLDKLEPIGKKIFSTNAEYSNKEDTDEQKNNSKKEDFSSIGGTIYFTEIPKKHVLYNAKPEELTMANFDKSIILKGFLEQEYKNDLKLLFGELQFAFVVFILGENVEGFEQWKKFITLFAFSDNLAIERPDIYLDLIPILYSQLQQFPEDFFVDAISANSFMSSCLENILSLAYDERIDVKLRGRVKKLEVMLKEKFKFNKDTAIKDQFDLGEDAPTLVEDFNFISFD